MCLDRFLLDLETEFEELCWRESPRRLRVDHVFRLQNQRKNCEAAIARCESAIAHLNACISECEQLETHLSERVPIYLHVGDRQNAWQLALELDQLRSKISNLRREISLQNQVRNAEADKLEQLEEDISSAQMAPH